MQESCGDSKVELSKIWRATKLMVLENTFMDKPDPSEYDIRVQKDMEMDALRASSQAGEPSYKYSN